MPDSHRVNRVGERLREELARLLREEIRDPRVAGVYVTRVTVTSDLQHATVGVRVTTSDGIDSPHANKQALAGLKSASGRLRTMLARALDLRRAIELRFVYDDGLDALSRVEQLLGEISIEQHNKK